MYITALALLFLVAHITTADMTTQLKSGHKAEALNDEDGRRSKDFPGEIDGLVRVEPGGWTLPSPYLDMADKIFDFKFRASDVVIMTHPKCGTTWAQDLVWNMMHNPNIDNPEAEEYVNIRSPHLELDILLLGKNKELVLSNPNDPFLKPFLEICPGANPEEGIVIQMTAVAPGVRIIKTHLTFPLLASDLLDTAKVVYVSRNPKDMCVSYFHHCRMVKIHDFQGDLDLFVDYLTNDKLYFGPFWNHVKEGWKHREHPNFYFLFYENLKADPTAEVKKLNKFLGTNLTEEQMEKVIDHTSFEKMQERDNDFPVADEMLEKVVNQEEIEKEGGFFRKGQVGSFRSELTPEQEAKIDAWTRRNTKGMDIPFRYSI